MQEKTLKYNKSKPKKIIKEVDEEVVKGFQELLKAPATLTKDEAPSTITELMASIEPLKFSSKPKNCQTSSFKNLGRKALSKQLLYNDEIQYQPKYDLVRKSTDSLVKYSGSDASKIPFHDSRFDIFYGNDQVYTQQMLIEDELAGDWVYNDEPSQKFKTPLAGSLQAVKRTSALKKLYRNYSQSKEFQKQKQVRE